MVKYMLFYSKSNVKWVPRMLTGSIGWQKVVAAKKLMELHKTDTFLSKIVTYDEIWVHHNEKESKRKSMEYADST